MRLVNETEPSLPPLPESDRSDMAAFVDYVRIVLPVLGVNVFRSVAVSTPATEVGPPQPTSPVFEMRVQKDGVTASAQEVDGEFTVLAGSRARAQWIGTGSSGYQALREQLERDGVVAVTDGVAVFTRDFPFDSPSAAAAVVAGRSSNGRAQWRLREDATTFGQWQTRGVDPSR